MVFKAQKQHYIQLDSKRARDALVQVTQSLEASDPHVHF